MTAPRLSIILIDWKVRESFHSIRFLNDQTAARGEYELIWVEYFDHRPEEIRKAHESGQIDQWLVLGREGMYFKHAIFNAGVAASRGEIICVCDSDAVFSPDFVASVLETYAREGDKIVLYLEEVRTDNRSFYPFRNHTWDEIMNAPGLMNWDAARGVPKGLTNSHDTIHTRNYGACMCVAREALLKHGGFDEHPAYHAFMCGPYELGWRLVNDGFREIWHEKEWLLHTWHPWVKPESEVVGEHDGLGVNVLAREVLRTGRVDPFHEGEAIRGAKGLPVLPVPRWNPIPAVDPIEEMSIAPASRMLAPVQVPKLLLVAPRDPERKLLRSLFTTGLAGEIELFQYDEVVFRFGPEGMEEQFLSIVRNFQPDLIVVKLLEREIEGIEPRPEIFERAREISGGKICIHEPSPLRTLKFADFIGGPDRSIPTWPAIDSRVFRPGFRAKETELLLWGPMTRGGERERQARLLREAGFSVETRLYRVSATEYAKRLSGAEVVVISPGEESNVHRRDFLEALHCGAFVVAPRECGITPFIPGEHFVAYSSDNELVEAIRSSDPVIRGRIARAGYRCATRRVSGSVMWGSVFSACGFRARHSPAARARLLIERSAPARRAKGYTARRSLAGSGGIAIFGAGPSGEQCLDELVRRGWKPLLFLDNDRNRHGKKLRGLPISSISEVVGDEKIDTIVLSFQGKKRLVEYQLKDAGFSGEVIDFDLIRKR